VLPVLGRLMVVMERSVMDASEREKSETVLQVLQCFRVKLGTKGSAHPW